MSIELVKKGVCKDCPLTKTSIEIINGLIEYVKCEHEQACRRAWELGYEEAMEDMNK